MKKGRIIQENKTNYIIESEGTKLAAIVKGSFFDTQVFPKVGDFILYSQNSQNTSEDKEEKKKKIIIEEILPRESIISRKIARIEREQIVATNIDIVFIVMGLDGDFNVNRLERYILLAQKSNIKPVVILNKEDSVGSPEKYIELCKSDYENIPIHTVSAKTGKGMDVFWEYLQKEKTAILLGSSGAGKSTITNWLLEKENQKTKDVRADDSRGRHTTTSRQLFTLHNGSFLIDTPGMRELTVMEGNRLKEEFVFQKIEERAKRCMYAKCDHKKTEGCQVILAIERDEISRRYVDNFLKLEEEENSQKRKYSPDISKNFKEQQKKKFKSQKKAQRREKFSDTF